MLKCVTELAGEGGVCVCTRQTGTVRQTPMTGVQDTEAIVAGCSPWGGGMFRQTR